MMCGVVDLVRLFSARRKAALVAHVQFTCVPARWAFVLSISETVALARGPPLCRSGFVRAVSPR